MVTHELKSWPQFFDPAIKGLKTFEVRVNDRGFQVGDVLHIREWNPGIIDYTGRSCKRLITHITTAEDLVGAGGPLEAGYVLLSLWRFTVAGQEDHA